jgi:hypothetical protein
MKVWDRLVEQGKTEVKGTLTMKTSLNDNNEVSLKAYLKKPSLL